MASTTPIIETGLDLATADTYLANTYPGINDGDFMAAVTVLYDARARLAVVKTKASAVQNRLARFYASGTRRCGDSRFTRVQVPPKTQNRVLAADIKASNPRLWAACRVWVPQVKVECLPRRGAPPAVSGLGGQLSAHTSIHSLLTIHARISAVRQELTEQADAHKAALMRLAQLADWNGHPLMFTDGWRARTATLQFDSDALAAKDPKVYAALVQPVTTAGYSYIRIRPVTDDGEYEKDEIDGE